MAKGLIGGMTDYSHQSFQDVLDDIKRESDNTLSFKNQIQDNLNIIIANSYWQKNVPFNFRNIVAYSLKHYDTTITEFNDIHNDLKNEVKDHHIKRLNNIAMVASQINKDIGKIWHQQYDNKDYDNTDFKVVEQIYCDTRDMAVNLLDTANIAKRLQDFIGKQDKTSGKKKFKLELGHKIALASLAVAMLVFLFGNNIVGRFGSDKSENKIIADTTNLVSTDMERSIDTLKLPYLEAVPNLDKGLFIKYYFNDLIFGGANIDIVRINTRTKSGEYSKIKSSNNEIIFDITAEPYIEIEYKKKFYSFEIVGRHYSINCIIREIVRPTLQLKEPE